MFVCVNLLVSMYSRMPRSVSMCALMDGSIRESVGGHGSGDISMTMCALMDASTHEVVCIHGSIDRSMTMCALMDAFF